MSPRVASSCHDIACVQYVHAMAHGHRAALLVYTYMCITDETFGTRQRLPVLAATANRAEGLDETGEEKPALHCSAPCIRLPPILVRLRAVVLPSGPW